MCVAGYVAVQAAALQPHPKHTLNNPGGGGGAAGGHLSEM